MKLKPLAFCLFYFFSLIAPPAFAKNYSQIHRKAKAAERKLASKPTIQNFTHQGKKYFVQSRVHPNGVVKEQISISPGINEITLDRDGDGNPDYHEVQKKGVTVKTYNPVNGIYRQVKIEKNLKDGTETTHLIYDPKINGYTLINRSFQKYQVLKKEGEEIDTSVIIDMGDECDTRNDEQLNLADDFVNMFTAIADGSELYDQIKASSSVLQDSCKKDVYQKSTHETLTKAITTVLENPTADNGRSQYLQCLEDNRLPVYAAKIRARVMEHLQGTRTEPLIRCEKPKPNVTAEYFTDDSKKYIGWYSPAENLNRSFLSSHYYEANELEVPRVPAGKMAQKNFEKIFFHEMIHAAGITTERFTHAIEECCGNPSSPGSVACKEMREYVANENTLEGFFSVLGDTDAYAAFNDYGNSLFKYDNDFLSYEKDMARDLYTLHAKHLKAYVECRKSVEECRNDLEKNVSDEMLPIAKAACESRVRNVTTLPTGKSCQGLTDKYAALIKELARKTQDRPEPQPLVSPSNPQNGQPGNSLLDPKPPDPFIYCPTPGAQIPKERSNIWALLFVPRALANSPDPNCATLNTPSPSSQTTGGPVLPSDGMGIRRANPNPANAGSTGTPTPGKVPYRNPSQPTYTPARSDSSIYKGPSGVDIGSKMPRIGSSDFRQDVVASTRRSSALADSFSSFARGVTSVAKNVALPAAVARTTRTNSGLTQALVNSANLNSSTKASIQDRAPIGTSPSIVGTGNPVAAAAGDSPTEGQAPTAKGSSSQSTASTPIAAASRLPSSSTPASNPASGQAVAPLGATPTNLPNSDKAKAMPTAEAYTRAKTVEIITNPIHLKQQLSTASFVMSLIENKIQIILENGDVVGSKNPASIFRWDKQCKCYKEEKVK